MNTEKINKDSTHEFNNLYKLIDDDNGKIKECFYYLLFKDLIQINNEKYKKMSSKDFTENSNDILLDYLYNIYFKISNNQPYLLPILKSNIIKKKNEIESKLKECKEHMDILKKNYDNILLIEYIPIKDDIKFLFENKTVLRITEPDIFNVLLSEFITRYIFSSIEYNKNISVNILENKNQKIDEKIDEKIDSLFDYFKYENFYSPEKINSYINKNNNIIEFNKFSEIHDNFKYWYILISLIDQIFSANSKYNNIFNKNDRIKYIKSILSPNIKKEKSNSNKKTNFLKKFFGKGGANINKKKLPKKNDPLKSVLNNLTSRKSLPKQNRKNLTLPSTHSQLLNHATIIKEYERIFLISNLKKVYIDSYNTNLEDYFIQKIDTKNNKITYDKNSLFINPFSNAQSIKLNNIINIKDDKTYTKDEIKQKIKHSEFIFKIFEFLNNYLNNNNFEEIDNFTFIVKKKLILILYKLYEIKSIIYNKYISIINSLFDLNSAKNSTQSSTQRDNNVVVVKTLKNNNIIVKKKVEQNILNNSSVNITVKIKLLTNKIMELNNKQGIVFYDMEKLQLEDKLKKLIVDKYNIQKRI